MATLNNEDTDSEEKELANTFELFIINITKRPLQTRDDENDQVFLNLAYMD